jgi:hypothetical protein
MKEFFHGWRRKAGVATLVVASLRLSLLIAVCSLLYGCSGPTGKDRDEFATISSGISRASSVTLLEGLPHQHYEPEQLKQERDAKQTTEIGGFPFYERPLKITDADVETLRQLTTPPGNFTSHPDGVAKSCGGFHPDYCVVWKDGDQTYEMLICFGCRDAMFYGSTQKVLLEIGEKTFRHFKATLGKYHDQRPEPQYGLGAGH